MRLMWRPEPAAETRNSRQSSRRALLQRWLLLGAATGGLAACGRSSMVRYPDGGRYRGGDIPNTEANVPSSGGGSTF
ncbi:hypothetical protein SAMN07250955_101516 [Arboricoccus pini]|uniref:Uncharacterized protein n=1 Tax=Arboricoccus pini TaxID=1963835 RepID=A0A212Q9L9_9PROT|nr:hypothetical protein [Arboricoccus pini]SNB56053.1 hypothetical protein SAMN07250955_101516 [Arboricoccus pini]